MFFVLKDRNETMKLYILTKAEDVFTYNKYNQKPTDLQLSQQVKMVRQRLKQLGRSKKGVVVSISSLSTSGSTKDSFRLHNFKCDHLLKVEDKSRIRMKCTKKKQL